ncbi:MAG: type IV pilin protein [Burkholderiaceae bacterium]|nr:MAG: type IV pilin protein [Burkholderiaceae bacterium]
MTAIHEVRTVLNPPRPARKFAGFTLMEVMIVVAIVAILSAIAYPSYQEYVRRSKRADARTQLLEVSQYMQRFYSQNDRYDQANDAAGTAISLPAALATVPRGMDPTFADYTIGFQEGTLSARGFTLEAVPRTGGPMVSDKCGTLRINNVGRRSVNGATGGMNASICWR